MSDFGKLYAAEAHKKQVLLEELSKRDAEIESLRSRLAGMEALYVQACEQRDDGDAHIESLCKLVEWWAPKDGTPRTADARAHLSRNG